MAYPTYSSTPLVPMAGAVVDPGTSASQVVNTVNVVSLDRMGAVQVAEMGGRNRAMSHLQHVFYSTVTTAAQAIPVITTTNGSTFALVNPAGSSVLLEPIDFQLDFLMTNAAPATANVVGFSFVSNAVNAFSAITKAPTPTGGGGVSTGGQTGYLGKPLGTGYVATGITFASALTVAANWGYPMFSFPASWVPTVGGYPVPLTHDFKGKILLPAGYCMTLVASTVWGSNTTVPSISWVEYPA